MVKTDVTAYFDVLHHQILLSAVEPFVAHEQILDALRRMLRAWSLAPGQGIPQGPNASRFLQNLYFASIDFEMSSQGDWQYSRYVDDIRIMARSKKDALLGLRSLERQCRTRAMVLSAQKTFLLEGAEVHAELNSPVLDRIEYLWIFGQWEEARPILKDLVLTALRQVGEIPPRDMKFGLYRLGLLHDRSVLARVLANLGRLGPVAPLVSMFMRPWVRETRTHTAIASYLNDRTEVVSPYLASWLLATFADSRRPLPDGIATFARHAARDRNQPRYLRAIAAACLGQSGTRTDVDWLVGEVKTEFDPFLLRAYLVGLRKANRLDSGSVSRAVGRASSLKRTTDYLAGVRDLPTMLATNESGLAFDR
jgi:hypothetical protein